MKNPQQLSFTFRIKSKVLTNHSLKTWPTSPTSSLAKPSHIQLTLLYFFPYLCLECPSLRWFQAGCCSFSGTHFNITSYKALRDHHPFHFHMAKYSLYCLTVLKLKHLSLSQIILSIHLCIYCICLSPSLKSKLSESRNIFSLLYISKI